MRRNTETGGWVEEREKKKKNEFRESCLIFFHLRGPVRWKSEMEGAETDREGVGGGGEVGENWEGTVIMQRAKLRPSGQKEKNRGNEEDTDEGGHLPTEVDQT